MLDNKDNIYECQQDRVVNLPSKKIKYMLILGVILASILTIISLFTGVYDITKDNFYEIFKITRISRTLALILTGASMSVCGLIMQVITRNKMVEPTTTGTIEWAGLGLIFVYLFIPSPTLLLRTIAAIIFSFIGSFIFFAFLRKVRLKSSVIVPIIGMMLGAIVSSISSFIGLMTNSTQILSIWFSGSFANIEQGRYELLWLVVAITIVIYIFADKLTLVGLGEDIATNLGIDYNKIVLLATIIVSMAVGIVSSVIGNIPFIGLIVPNIISRYFGDNLRTNLPFVCLLGIIILLICDILARVIIMPFEVPVSLIMGSLGSMIFLYLILSKGGNHE